MRLSKTAFVAAALMALLGGCGHTADLTVAQGTGPAPVLPEPTKTLLPTINVADAEGWPAGAVPTPAEGLRVNAFATGLDHPRWLLALPNGDVLVAESAAPPPPEQHEDNSLRASIMRMYMRKAGSAVPSANRITLLRDADGDGVAEMRSPYLTGLTSPFGMALVGDTLYVANADALVAFPYQAGATRIDAPPRTITALPAEPQPSLDQEPGRQPRRQPPLCRRRLEQQCRRARHGRGSGARRRSGRSTLRPAATASTATGLRNPVGIAFQPGTSDLLWSSSTSATSSAATSCPTI